MTFEKKSIFGLAVEILNQADVDQKVNLTHQVKEFWFAGKLTLETGPVPPGRPGRPKKPELLLPKNMPRRRNAKARAARIAMLHAIAHIELNAIDLAWDLIARFGVSMPRSFIDDWVKVADDEARHFILLNKRLEEFQSSYGDLPAHDGLWQSAENTAHDFLARLAIVPLVLEARGLDVTPALIKKFMAANDQQSVSALQIIYSEEIEHVRSGQRWFTYICNQQGLNPEKTYQKYVKKYFAGGLISPFNIEARYQAGLTESFYMPLINGQK